MKNLINKIKYYFNKYYFYNKNCFNNNNKNWKKWYDKFNEVKLFIQDNKSMPLEKAKDPKERTLGQWCGTQRGKYKKGKLEEERRKELEGLELWYWNLDLDSKWYDKLNKLKLFIQDNKSLPSSTAKDPKEKTLGNWCVTQRVKYKKGELEEEIRKELEEIEQWFWKKDYDSIWYDKFNELKLYIQDNKSLPLEKAKDPKEKSLGQWCVRQRFKYKKGELEEERIKELDGLEHWYWDIDSKWYDKLNELKLFIQENKSLPSQYAKDPKEKTLGYWCDRQRTKYKNGTLEEDRREALEELEQWFWNNDSIWFKKLNELKLFIQENKSLPSQVAKDPKEKTLGLWCGTQRVKYKKGELEEERKKELEELDLWFWKKYKKGDKK